MIHPADERAPSLHARVTAAAGGARAVPRTIRVGLRSEWSRDDPRGLLSADGRVRTLRKVLVTYPDVRHILPDRISFDAAADARLLATVRSFLERQHWLVQWARIE